MSDVVVRRDVVHTQVEGYRPLCLDLYTTDRPRALAVYLHGGGWLVGSRRSGPGPLGPASGRLFERAARSGLAVASVDYRLSGEARFPAQMDDIEAAIGYLESHRDELGLSDVPLVLWGVSAGGHLAALRGLSTTAVPRAHAVAAWYPVTDLFAMSGHASADTREAWLLGAAPDDVPDLARAASPAALAHADAPPFLLLHGADDDLVPPDQSVRLHDALVAAGSTATLELLPGQRHMFAGMPDVDVEALVDRTVAFLLG